MVDREGGHNVMFIRNKAERPVVNQNDQNDDQNRDQNVCKINITVTVDFKKITPIILRLIVILMTLAAAIVMGITKAKRYCQHYVLDHNDPQYYTSSSPYTVNFPELVYFIAINAISSFFSALLFFIQLYIKPSSSTKKTSMVYIMMEIVSVVLLFSSIGSAWTLKIIGDKVVFRPTGQWEAVRCSKVWDFFHQVTIAVSLSTVGASLNGVLVLMALKDIISLN